jgi:phosphoglycerate dehydrogenase-like enzyme
VNTLPEWAKRELNSLIIDKTEFKITVREGDLGTCEIYFGDIITPKVVRRMPRLKWVHFASTGINRALIPEIKDSKIYVTNTPYAFTESLAHLILTYVFSLGQAWYGIDYLRKEGELKRERFEQYAGGMCTLAGEKCLIVGLGRIGRCVADKLESLGMDVDGIKRCIKNKNADCGRKIHDLGDLKEIVGRYRYIINLLPLTESTHRIFDKDIFAEMSSNSFFINAGRGKTVNEKDLLQALKQKEIQAAALDVFEEEPLSNANELLQLDNILVTPHIGNLNGNHWPSTIDHFKNYIVKYVNNVLSAEALDLSQGY